MADQYYDEVQTLLARVFQVSAADISPDLGFGDLPQWDSMGHMDVMLSLEEQFGIAIDTDTISELISVPAICAYLAKKS